MEWVLDLGCGDGGFEEIIEDQAVQASWLLRNGHERSIGVDISPQRICSARKLIRNGTIFAIADGRNLPFSDECFSQIHESGALHHINNYDFAISEIVRVLRRGGRLYLMEAVDNNPWYAVVRRMVSSWEGMKIDSYFTSDVLLRKLEKEFCIEKVGYYYRSVASDAALSLFGIEPPLSLKGCRMVSRLLNGVGLGRRLCCHLIVECVKR